MASLLHHLASRYGHTPTRDRALFTGRGAITYSRIVPWLMRPYYAAVARDVARHLPAAGHVLDIGTGHGALSTEIARSAPTLRVTGVDLAADMVDQAHQRAARLRLQDRVTFQCADAAALPLPDDSVDLVVSTLSAHHWNNLPGVLRDLARVSRPGAQVWLYDAWGFQYDRDALARALESLPLSLDAYATRGPGLLGHWITRVTLVQSGAGRRR